MQHTLHLDIESKSGTSLPDAGVYRYAEDPQFEILMCGWAVDYDRKNVQVALGFEEIDTIPGLWDDDVTKIAHNAMFERVCFSRFRGLPTGQYLDPRLWHDTQAMAAERGYPHSLEDAALWIGGEQKDPEGKALVRFFCIPKKDGTFNRPEDFPEKWEKFIEYCRQDVVTLISIDEHLGGFPSNMERAIWEADQHVNDIGMKINLAMAQAATEAGADNRIEQEVEFMRLTGVDNPGSGPQVLAWAKKEGLPISNLQAETIVKQLERTTLSPKHRRVLELRQELALTAAKKFETALERVCRDDRLRGGFRFHGAHTGRWTGSGVQPQNLPRASFMREDPETGKYAWDGEGEALALAELLLTGEADAQTLKKLVRALFLVDGCVVDYASIEARVIARAAGEQWALDAFYNGRDIYVETAERMGGLTRSQGKVAVLALGFAGGIESLRAMGGEGSDEFLQKMVTQWRNANQKIVALWADLDAAFKDGGPVGTGWVNVEVDGDDRILRLPSGRALVYHDCRWAWETVQTKWGPKKRLIVRFKNPAKNSHGPRASTYGGRLAENLTQGIARDILGEALVRLLAEGYRPIGHVHDEILVEGTTCLDDVKRIMVQPPTWADGLPIDAEGFLCNRYRKG